MSILNMLSKAKISLSVPKWLITILMFFRTGTRGVSLGVRLIIFDESGAVFLVRHSYVNGWYLPGGGVDRGETALAAAKREMREEARMLLIGGPQLHGVFLYDAYLSPDHICCYIVRDWQWDSADGARPASSSLDGEILEGDFFPLDHLPEGTTQATRARLREVAQHLTPDDMWLRLE